MSVVLSTAHRAALSTASIDLADAAQAVSTLRFFDAQDGNFLAALTLQRPCGTVNLDGRVQLLPDTEAGDKVARSGTVGWMEWCDGDDAMLVGCTVTDESGAGPIKMPGTSGTQVYAGGVVSPAGPVILG